MKIEAIIIFPNVGGIFHLRNKINKYYRVGWVTTKWQLTQMDNKTFWKRVTSRSVFTLSLDKKKREAKRYNLPIIYLDKERARQAINGKQAISNRAIKAIPYREGDI